MEIEPSPTMQRTQAQPPELIKEVVAQSPLYPKVTVPAPDQDHAEHPTSPSIPVKPLDRELTTTPEPATECEHSTALQQTTAPPPKHPEVTLATAKPDSSHNSTYGCGTYHYCRIQYGDCTFSNHAGDPNSASRGTSGGCSLISIPAGGDSSNPTLSSNHSKILFAPPPVTHATVDFFPYWLK